MIYFLCLYFDVNLAFFWVFRSSLSVSGSWEGGGSNLVDLHGLVTQYIHTDLTDTAAAGMVPPRTAANGPPCLPISPSTAGLIPAIP